MGTPSRWRMPLAVASTHQHARRHRRAAQRFIAGLKCCRLAATACAARTHYIRYFWFGNQKRRWAAATASQHNSTHQHGHTRQMLYEWIG
ncbi:putative major surface protease gp63 [Leptomonas seymouri]|uniref:Putative major surface protease gp63 n=1 Tax=Leptomonas seymouri TaxID=5684 RepID=A0A0N1IFU7_LEPSE|nr:putative major surface protease gp63 [Leptomonas seymouri]|eukprot:KPI82440.1 putative major surface protease gp63 [Leptomonas seymouri]